MPMNRRQVALLTLIAVAVPVEFALAQDARRPDLRSRVGGLQHWLLPRSGKSTRRGDG